MRKFVTLMGFILVSAAAGQLHAQSFKNTNWKFYVEPLHDTLTWHVTTDSCFSTTSSGEVVVRSVLKVDKETLKMTDYAGEYACDGEGIYKYVLEGDILTLTLVTDNCQNRSGVLAGAKFYKVPVK